MLHDFNLHLAAYQKGERCLLWNPDTGIGIVGKKALLEKVHQKLPSMVSNKAVLEFFDTLYKENANHVLRYSLWKEQLDGEGEGYLHSLRLTLVTQCNLKCVYCYQEEKPWANYRMNSKMEWPMAKKALDYYFQNTVRYTKKARIFIYGGEPFLHWPVLKKIVEYAQNESSLLKATLFFNAITNGTLLNPEKMDFIIQNHVGLAISVDGIWDTHDRARPTRGGGGSFNKIHEALLYFREKKYDALTLGCTMNVYNIHNLQEYVNYAQEIGIKNLSLNDDFMTPSPFSAQLEEELMIQKTVEFIHECFKKGITPGGFYVNRLVKFARYLGTNKKICDDILSPKRCGGCGTEMNVLPNGEIKACPGIQQSLGHIDKIEDAQYSPTMQKMKKRNVTTLLECKTCPIRGICVGGCSANVEQFKKGELYAKPSNCSLYYNMFFKFAESIL